MALYIPSLSVHSLTLQLLENPLVENSLCINVQGHIAVKDRIKVIKALTNLLPGSIEYAIVKVAIENYDGEQKRLLQKEASQ